MIKILDKVVEITQRYFREGDIPRTFFYEILVIILKDDYEYSRGISLPKVTHRLMSRSITLYMTKVISFCGQIYILKKEPSRLLEK